MIRIVADSTCDLNEELAKKYDISILPLHIILGDKEYIDGVDITPDMIFKYYEETGNTPKTSAPSIDDAINLFKPIIDAGDEIIAFSISENISSSFNVMKMAAEELGASSKITVINSKSLCFGIGLLAIKASMLAKDGKSLDEINSIINETIPKVNTSFIVDELTYLYKGGRCSGIANMATSVLKLHPVINMVDGVLIPGTKYRGKINKVVDDYVSCIFKSKKRSKVEKIILAYTGDLERTCSLIKDQLKALGVAKNIVVLEAGCVITSHCGPKTFGLFFIDE